MTPAELAAAAAAIGEREPNALIYPNRNTGVVRNPEIPDNALAVDVDRAWPHDCDGDEDCVGCLGGYRLVAWISILGKVYWTDSQGNRYEGADGHGAP